MGTFRDFLSDTLFVVGVAIVVLSILQPFSILYNVRWFQFRRVLFSQVDLFTFKVNYVPDAFSLSKSWNVYWFNSEKWYEVGSGTPSGYLLMVSFVVQILTFALGLFTLSSKPRMRIPPLALCLVTTFLLTWVFNLANSHYSLSGFHYSWNLGYGYWLNLASVLCLLSSIILARGRQSRIMFER